MDGDLLEAEPAANPSNHNGSIVSKQQSNAWKLRKLNHIGADTPDISARKPKQSNETKRNGAEF